MTWLPDVAPYGTIQSLWGNSIRDRVVQTFADRAEADSHLASLPNGAVVHLDSDGTLLTKTAGVWRPVFPGIVRGTNAPQTSIAAGAGLDAITAVIPAGYRYAVVLCTLVVDIGGGVNSPWAYDARILTSAGGVGIATVGGGNTGPATSQSIQCNTYLGLNPAAGDTIRARLSNTGGPQPLIFRTDGLLSQLNALCIP